MPAQHIFAGNPLDRGERERRDEKWIKDQISNPTSKFLPIWESRVLVSSQEPLKLGWLDSDQLANAKFDSAPFLLGMLNDSTYFTIDMSKSTQSAESIEKLTDYKFEDSRTAAEALELEDTGILAQARAQINWHNRHGFCSVCGNETSVKRGGQKRECTKCEAEHFPRVDPVIIMVVHDRDYCLLGQSRGRLAATNRYSALAGFVDQAESIEEAVSREVMEEAGIRVKNVTYHSSQPWPFPSSLMIGCHAEADTTEISMDTEEMTDVKWFNRQEVLAALNGENANLLIPGRIAIAHHLIRSWAEGEISQREE
ncbi:MAG: NAD(+) diphosphatase [Chloroflexota bacterium]|nr:NAD(+) diphosphatase [Chloroflexota bacterium]